jgi:hypothetical protein
MMSSTKPSKLRGRSADEPPLPRRVIPRTLWRLMKRGAKSSKSCGVLFPPPARNTIGGPLPPQSSTSSDTLSGVGILSVAGDRSPDLKAPGVIRPHANDTNAPSSSTTDRDIGIMETRRPRDNILSPLRFVNRRDRNRRFVDQRTNSNPTGARDRCQRRLKMEQANTRAANESALPTGSPIANHLALRISTSR